MSDQETTRGMIISATRRRVDLVDAQGRTFEAHASSKTLEVVIGDQVIAERRGNDWLISEISPRHNLLQRASRERSKRFAANVDHLFVVTATGALFNHLFIDRALVCAAVEHVPVTLVLNKSDLPAGDSKFYLPAYGKLGVQVLETSIHDRASVVRLERAVHEAAKTLVAFCGVSGVGKSSLLNLLIPDAACETADVSTRTGQGRQTTTQSRAYRLPDAPSSTTPRYLIDLPGFQQFGLAHLDPSQVEAVFTDFAPFRVHCEFSNCLHHNEQSCAVRDAVESEQLWPSRYLSYLDILNELERAKGLRYS